jgi:phage-related protein
MKRWQIEFFEEQDGARPVQAWLDGLPGAVRGKVLARIDLLAQHGPTLDHPYTSQIEGKLREVRVRLGKTRYRVLYFFDESRVGVLLHGFTKNTAAVEETDKRIAHARMVQHAERGEHHEELMGCLS